MNETTLVFAEEKPRWSWLFPVFLFVSLCLHLIGFYLFQVVYRDPVEAMARPASLTLLRASNPEDTGILQWIAAEDPAIAARPPAVHPTGLLEMRYVPSYDLPLLEPLLPETVEPVAPPRTGRDAQDIVAQALRTRPTPSRAVPAPPTRLIVSGALATRLPARSNPPTATLPSEREPTRFLAGVSPSGATAFVFLQAGSGDAATDDAALRHLRGLKFQRSADGETAWGTVSYYWGSGRTPGDSGP